MLFYKELDSKSGTARCVGSIPTGGTTLRLRLRVADAFVRQLKAVLRRRSVARSFSEGGLEHFMYYVYLLRSIDFPDKTYIGFSEDLKQRLNSQIRFKLPPSQHSTSESKPIASKKNWARRRVITVRRYLNNVSPRTWLAGPPKADKNAVTCAV